MDNRKLLYHIKLCLAVLLGCAVITTIIIPIRSNFPDSASGSSNSLMDTSKTGEQNPLTSNDYTQIVEKNPFGKSGTKKDILTARNSVGSVSEQLKLALNGTISGSKLISRAIIQDLATGQCQSYRINEAVKGAIVQEIGEDSVTLEYEGEKIHLQLNTSSQNNSSFLWPSKLNNNSVKNNSPKAESTNPSPAYNKFQQLNTILRSAVIEPQIVNGRAEGLRLSGIENIEAAQKIGLKNGDVIRSVNGHILTNTQQAFQVMKKVKSSESVNIELVRNNRIKQLSFDLF